MTEFEREEARVANNNAKKLKRALANFEFIRNIRIVSGSFSQSILRFLFVPSCLANSIVAALYPKDPVNWTSADLDNILENGHLIYHLILKNAGTPDYHRELDAWDVEWIQQKVIR